MTKVSIEQIETTLLEQKIEASKVQEIIRDLIKAAEEEKADRSSDGPKPKWEHIIIINDPDGKIKEDFTGWVVTQLEGQDSGLVLSKLTDATKNQKDRKSTRLNS